MFAVGLSNGPGRKAHISVGASRCKLKRLRFHQPTTKSIQVWIKKCIIDVFFNVFVNLQMANWKLSRAVLLNLLG